MSKQSREARRLAAAVAAAPRGPSGPDWFARAFAPVPIVRLEVIRILAPLAILAFMAGRIVHADDWLSNAGFVPPDLGGDARQPLPLPALPVWAAWTVASMVAVAALAVAAGAFTRWSSALFAALLFYVALADRMSAFTVSKIGPIIVLALALSPAGTRFSLDAWWRRRRGGPPPPTQVSGGCVCFFQVMLAVFYFSSGVCKARNDWLAHYDPLVLYTQLHDSYQTVVSWWLANHVPAFGWTAMQWTTLVFEIGAPVWFALRWTRPYALAYGIAMHVMIGLMFGPVLPFGLLMIALLIGSYAPAAWLERALTIGRLRIEKSRDPR